MRMSKRVQVAIKHITHNSPGVGFGRGLFVGPSVGSGVSSGVGAIHKGAIGEKRRGKQENGENIETTYRYSKE